MSLTQTMVNPADYATMWREGRWRLKMLRHGGATYNDKYNQTTPRWEFHPKILINPPFKRANTGSYHQLYTSQRQR